MKRDILYLLGFIAIISYCIWDHQKDKHILEEQRELEALVQTFIHATTQYNMYEHDKLNMVMDNRLGELQKRIDALKDE